MIFNFFFFIASVEVSIALRSTSLFIYTVYIYMYTNFQSISKYTSVIFIDPKKGGSLKSWLKNDGYKMQKILTMS